MSETQLCVIAFQPVFTHKHYFFTVVAGGYMSYHPKGITFFSLGRRSGNKSDVHTVTVVAGKSGRNCLSVFVQAVGMTQIFVYLSGKGRVHHIKTDILEIPGAESGKAVYILILYNFAVFFCCAGVFHKAEGLLWKRTQIVLPAFQKVHTHKRTERNQAFFLMFPDGARTGQIGAAEHKIKVFIAVKVIKVYIP